MAWIELHQALKKHPKTLHLAALVGCADPDHARVKLENLWLWALDYCLNGALAVASRPLSAIEVADASDWRGDPTVWMRSLIDAGWIDEKAGGKGGKTLYLHDWHVYAGRLIEQRELYNQRQNRKRDLYQDLALIKDVRARDGDSCRYCGRTVNWKDRKGQGGGTYDHIDPDGENTLENIVVCCRSCNSRKNRRTPEEAEMQLLPRKSAEQADIRQINPDKSAHQPTVPTAPTSTNRTTAVPETEFTDAPPGVEKEDRSADERLKTPNLRIGLLLLSAAPLGMEERIASSFASTIPIREIAVVCSEAESQKKPAAWARRALEGRWKRDAPIEDQVLDHLSSLLDVQAERVNGLTTSMLRRVPLVDEIPGESTEDRLARVNIAMKEKREKGLSEKGSKVK